MTAHTGGGHRVGAIKARQLVHLRRTPKLTLSEVTHGPRPDVPHRIHVGAPQDRTPTPDAADALSLAIGAHLSPVAAASVAAYDDPFSLSRRAAYVRAAMAAAVRCPICSPTLAPELAAAELEVLRRG